MIKESLSNMPGIILGGSLFLITVGIFLYYILKDRKNKNGKRTTEEKME